MQPSVFCLSPAVSVACNTVCCVCALQAALRAFDDDHNGALDQAEFERFAKSLMKTGVSPQHQHATSTGTAAQLPMQANHSGYEHALPWGPGGVCDRMGLVG